MSDPAVMSGTMRLEGGRLVGVIVDTFGFETHLTGEPGPDGWTLTAVVVVPPGLQIAGFDDAPSP